MIEKQKQFKKLVNRIKNRTIAVYYILKLGRCDVIRISLKGIDKVFKVDTSFLLVILWYIKKSGLCLKNSAALKKTIQRKRYCTNLTLIDMGFF